MTFSSPLGELAAVFASQAGTTDLGDALTDLLVEPERSLPLTDSTERGTWDAIHAALVIERAVAERDSPWPQPLARDAARFHRDGDRRAWEVPAFARTQRLSRAVIAATVTDDYNWLDDVVDGVTLVCEQSSWCWPAHDDAFTRKGLVTADVSDPYVDLGAGEIAGQLAWIDHVLGSRLDEHAPGIRERLRHEVRTRVLVPFLERDDWWWTGKERAPNNWTAWICQNVLVAALRLFDRPEDRTDRARAVALVVERIDRYVDVIPDDGAIDEGYSYWWAGASRLLETLETLTHATGGVLDGWTEITSLQNTVSFPHRMQLGGPWFVSVADSRARDAGQHPWRALYASARRVGDRAAEAFAVSRRTDSDLIDLSPAGLGRQLLDLVDADWRAAGGNADPLPAATWLPSTQMLIAREQEGSPRGLTMVVKAGHNGESHNHNDVGGIIVASDGVPVIIDAGQPTYTRQTFDGDRFALWVMGSEWHNVPHIDGRAQVYGPEYTASDVVCDGSSELRADLAGAYGLAERLRWRRGVHLDREARAVIVSDEAQWFDSADRPSEVRFLLAGNVSLGVGYATITPTVADAGSIVMSWDPARVAHMSNRELDDPRLTEIWGTHLTRIELDGPGTVRISQSTNPLATATR